MSAIVFQKSGLSDLTLERGRVFPVREPITINQDNYLTEAMNPKVVDYGSTLQLLRVTFKGLSEDNYSGTINGLKTWFSSSQVNWMENSFTMIDELGTIRTVRLWQKQFDMRSISPNRYSITLTLLEE